MVKILFVDDEPNIREVVGLYLRRVGHDVPSAADGEEELELYRRGRSGGPGRPAWQPVRLDHGPAAAGLVSLI